MSAKIASGEKDSTETVQERLIDTILLEKGAALLAKTKVTRIHEAFAEQAVNIDPMTRMLRHSAFRKALEFEMQQRQVSKNRNLQLLVVKIDGLEDINLKKGYDTGDRCIAMCARTIESLWLAHRSTRLPVFGRESGAHLAIVIPCAKEEEELWRAEQILESIERLPLNDARTTASIGIAGGEGFKTADDWVRAAKAAAENVSKKGGNSFEIFLVEKTEAKPDGVG